MNGDKFINQKLMPRYNLQKIFNKEQIYSEEELYYLAEKYELVTTDCIKDDQEITIGLDEDDEPRWEFVLISDIDSYPRMFKLRWSEFIC